MVKIPEEKFSYETICNSFLIFHFREREKKKKKKKKKKICLQDIHLQTPREISMLIFDYISPTYIYVLVPIHVLKKSVKYQQLSIIMEQYFGSPCRFLNPHVKLTFGKRKKKISTQILFLFSHRRFPYDRQNCTMKFGSWTYDSAKVNLRFYHNVQQFDLTSYVNSNEWKIIHNFATRNTEKYGKENSLFDPMKLIREFFFRLLSGYFC